jgi:hypothetical protein
MVPLPKKSNLEEATFLEENTLAVIIANNIWIEFTSAIKARLNHTKAKADW